MKLFFKRSLEGLYFLFNDPNKTQKQVLGNVKFFYPFPLFFLFTGLAAHLLVGTKWMVENVVPSQLMSVLFALILAILAYPISYKFIFPTLKIDELNIETKKNRIIYYLVYFFGGFGIWILLGWLTNYTSLL